MEKILLIDIENSPLIGYTWGIWEQNVIRKSQDSFILCAAYKWLGDKTVQITAQIDSPNYSKNKKDDKNVLEVLWKVLNEADIVIGHNLKAFDLKKINTRFIIHGMKPPAGYRVIDTLQEVRKKFKFDSNKLDSLGEELDLGRKVEHEGFDLWLSCMAGDSEAWKRMIKYNKQDVALLEKLYLELRPWMDNHPKINVIANRPTHCPTCLHPSLTSHGPGFNNGTKFKRYQCNGCGAWTKGNVEKVNTLYK